jgi:hypothetical protein
MKKISIAAICVMAGVALFLLYKINQPAPPPGSPFVHSSTTEPSASAPGRASGNPAPSSTASAAATGVSQSASDSSSPQSQDLSAGAGQVVPAINAVSNIPPEAAVQNVRRAVRQYGEMFGGDPVGNNPEITAQLTGKNPKQINFLNGVDGMRVNQNGELVDAWGIPYFFHQLSGSDMEVRSAGPDKIMWTSDDILTR